MTSCFSGVGGCVSTNGPTAAGVLGRRSGLDDGRVMPAWVYFYNAPLGGAPRIVSGDYLEYLKVK